MSDNPLIAAVVITFKPDEDILLRLTEIRHQVHRMVIVDNASPAATQTLLRSWASGANATMIENPKNCGLAAALNQGMQWSAGQGCEWAVTFDQDSTPQSGMVAALLATALSLPSAGHVAVVGAHTFDEQRPARRESWLTPRWWGFGRNDCFEGDLTGVTFVITSGALTRVAAWREVAGFDEGLFIDYIDHDFCLRAGRLGWRTAVSSKSRLAHNLGSKRQVDIMGRRLTPTFHNATRHYYMSRNRILMWRRHALRVPHWWLFDLCFGGLNSVRVLLAEDDKAKKVAAMLRGTWDGLLGRTGEMRDY